jgi:hypothetical protein
MNVPPPSPDLLRRVAAMQPVRTRVPLRSLGIAAATSVLLASGWLLVFPLRPDLASSPRVAEGLAWLFAFLVPLASALLPKPGQVVPDGQRAGIAAAFAAVGMLAFESLFGGGLLPASTRASFSCAAIIVCVGALVYAVGRLALWRVLPVGSWRIGAALGAAGGSLGAAMLHLLCPYGGALHTGLAHGGAVVFCTLLGAIALRR